MQLVPVADVATLQQVLARAPQYFMLERGEPAASSEAHDVLHECPPGADKQVLLALDDNGVAIGCVDVALGWPDRSTACIGLLLVVEDQQGRGVGRALYALVEDMLRPRFAKLRLGVLQRNERALKFWSAVGFVATGERKPHARGTITDEIVVFEKLIGRE